MRRLNVLITGETYHIYTKSIYGFIIFPSFREYDRMIKTLMYHQIDQQRHFSEFLSSYDVRHSGFEEALKGTIVDNESNDRSKRPRLIHVLAYCLMPTHVHLILQQTLDDGIRMFMERTLNSYSQFFNRLHNRRGPLWQSRFGASQIRSPEQLQEKIDYVHENPVKDLGLSKAVSDHRKGPESEHGGPLMKKSSPDGAQSPEVPPPFGSVS